MTEFNLVQLYADAQNPDFHIDSFIRRGKSIQVINKNDPSQKIDILYTTSNVCAYIPNTHEPKIHEGINENEYFLYFSDMIIKITGNINMIDFIKYEKYNHYLVLIFTKNRIYFYNIYFDSTSGKKQLKYLDVIEKKEVLYIFLSMVYSSGASEVYPFFDGTTSSIDLDNLKIIFEGYHEYCFKRTLFSKELPNGEMYINSNCTWFDFTFNRIQEYLPRLKGFIPQKMFSITLKKDSPGIMNIFSLPQEKILGTSYNGITTKNEIIFINPLEKFDISFFYNLPEPVWLHQLSWKIWTISNQKIMVIKLENDRVILWNLNTQKTYLYTASSSTKIDKKYLSISCWYSGEAGYIEKFPFIFLQDDNDETVPEDEKKYEFYCNFMKGEPLCIISIGKPQILFCDDGTEVYFIKTLDSSSNKPTGMMLVLDKDCNIITSRKNVNLVSIYNDSDKHSTKITYAFVEED